MQWETKRKIVYALAVIVILFTVAVLVAYSFRDVFIPPPTCVDKIKNGYETDVDCGGECSLMCSQDVHPVSALWAKAIHGQGEFYDIVAMIDNPNRDSVAYTTEYVFTIYGETGAVIATLPGALVAPLDAQFPLIIQNLKLPVVPKNVILSIKESPHVRVAEKSAIPAIKITGERFENGQIPRLYVTLINTQRKERRDLPVRVVLFDKNGNAYAVGQTLVPLIEREGSREVIITWDKPLERAPESVKVYPIITPFDGDQN